MVTVARLRLWFALFGGALAWTFHLFASYALVALGCMNGWSRAGPALGIVTLVALGLAVGAGIVARSPLLPSSAAPEGWHTEPGLGTDGTRFTLSLGARLSALFGFLIALGGLVPLLAPMCAVTR